MGRGSRGATIGGYLVAMATFAVFVITMVSVSTHHLHFAAQDYQQQAARNLAESALNQALAEVMTSPGQKFGSRGASTEVVRITNTAYGPGSEGVVCFHPLTADREKLPLSMNNFFGTGVRNGAFGRQVPVNTVHLVGVGICGSVRKSIEAIYYVPPFPNSLASAGPVRSRGGLLVAGVKDPARFTGNYANTPADNKAPSHVMSNSADPRAVELGDGAVIQGNVGAVGGIRLAPSVVVSGEVREFMEPQPLPDLDLDAIFAKLNRQHGKDILPNVVSGDYQLAWNAACPGDLHLTGSLDLHQGMLWVGGNLVVDGGITGEGAVYVAGETTVRRGADFRSTDQVALVSRRRIHLDGAGQSSYFFQGLLYSEEDIVASDVTVLGAVIARGLGGLQLDNVNVLNSPVTVRLIDGLVLPNQSDDDSTQLLLRVQTRDPVTLKALTYKAELRGVSDDYGADDQAVKATSAPIRAEGLSSYDEIKDFIQGADRSIWGPYTKNTFLADWFWNARKQDSRDIYSEDPLARFLEALNGQYPDEDRRFVLNVNPNEVLGVLDRPRVLLWQDAPAYTR
jgi:hypothetical protein